MNELTVADQIYKTSVGISYHGNALHAAKALPYLTPKDHKLLNRWLTGQQQHMDYIDLQDLSNKIKNVGKFKGLEYENTAIERT